MFCGKCGNEIPENETVCPTCGGEETVVEPVEEIVSEEVVFEENPDTEAFDIPVAAATRQKRGLARVIIGIVSLVIAVALVVVSLLNPVMLLGKWMRHEEMPLYEDVSLKVDLSIEFALSGDCTQYQKLVNADELGVPKAESEYTDHFQYAIVNEKIRLDEDVASDVCYKATPALLTIWDADYPENTLDYQRDGLFYPSMILWVTAGAFLILGVLLLVIPGKKLVVNTDAEEQKEFAEEIVEETYEEIAADSEDVYIEEAVEDSVTEEPIVEEVIETPEATEE